MNIADPSRFWEQLSAEHRAELSTHGIDHFKRHQALRYFTWRWSWKSIRNSEQFRFLLSETSLTDWIRCASQRTPLDSEAWAGTDWSVADRWLYSFAVRLLWSYAEAHDSSGALRLPEPQLGHPFPVRWRGRLISQDLGNSALEASAIGRALGGRNPMSIVEVGAGYGRLAYVLLNLYPQAVYTVVDIEPAIDISRWYLSKLFPARRLQFLSPAEADALDPASVDLALSISSLQEMTPNQVHHYLQLFDRAAAGGTVFLKQWETWTNPVDHVTMQLDRYPIPSHWRQTFRETAPVQTRFIQAAWHVPEGLRDTGPTDGFP